MNFSAVSIRVYHLLAAVASFSALCGGSSALAAPPNVIVFLSDDQGWGDLSVNGNTNLSTPNIDRMAQQGAQFDRFFVCPVCSPTRAEFLTGRYHPRGGVYSTSAGGERLDLDEVTVADSFRAAGYATAACGKWHNGMQYPYHPNGRGFDEYYGFCSGHWGHYFSPLLEHNRELTTGTGFLVDDFTNHAIRFIRQHRDQPFFVYLPYNTPHSPMQVPDEWWEKFRQKPLTMRHRDPEKEDLQFTRAALAMCENIDWNVGRVLAELDRLDLTDKTIVVYFNDNGPNSFRWNGGMKGRKGSTDEGGVRSPLIMRWPGHIRQNQRIQPIAGAIDLLPTLTDLAGIPHPADRPLDGRSLKPLLTEEQPNWADRVIVSHWNRKISARNQRFRLDQQGALFDMENDPEQRNDVADQFPDVARQLQDEVRRYRQEVLDGYPDENRPFILTHPDSAITQMPARDASTTGNIQRSNRFPNCSYFTNWTSTDEQITWNVDVQAEGEYDVELHYTCAAADVGSVVRLSVGDASVTAKIEEPVESPLIGAVEDRTERTESYVKDFGTMSMGTIRLTKGTTLMTLQALEIPGKHVMDFRLLMFRRNPQQ
ncbi:MAG: sulfatase-like hydrolase/transferase [Planctomycetaceae bacterium]|nr:sulfatase-like hydrolase/transferase [Planctomycetaceae bacterium]